jgi:hypothetical protein
MGPEVAAMSRRLALAVVVATMGMHVGSPDVVVSADAGPYPVRVWVRPPSVIPGRALVTVTLRSDTRIDSVRLQAIEWIGGVDRAPAPVAMTAMSGPGLRYAAAVWFMRAGSYGVRITVDGGAGRGSVTVPVDAQPTRRLAMRPAISVLLLAGGIALAVGLVAIVGAAAREGALPPTAEVAELDRIRSVRARSVTIVGCLVLAGAGAVWWQRIDRAFTSDLTLPYAAHGAVRRTETGVALELRVDDDRWYGDRVVPDHGKIMHLFAVRRDLRVFLHLHPDPVDGERFRAALPVIAAGDFWLFGDVTLIDGAGRTVVAEVSIPAAADSSSTGDVRARGDVDDAWWVEGSISSDPALRATAVFDETLPVGLPVDLAVRWTTAAGEPARLEPYMGMAGHAVVLREDGAVFHHLHPAGTPSAASVAIIERRIASEDAAASPASATSSGATVSFPYVFPEPGRYRVWVQVQYRGTVATEAFDVSVTDAEG